MNLGSIISKFSKWATTGKPEEGIRAGTAEADEVESALYMTSIGRITADRLSGILRNAADGEPEEMISLFYDILDKEPAISAHLSTRQKALLACDWTITAPEGVDSTELTQQLKDAEIDRLICHLSSAVPFGYALAATDWEKGGAKVNGWTMIHPVNVNFDFSGNAGVRVSGMPKSVNSWPEYQFVQCFPMSSPGIPSRVGLMRSIAWTYFFKINGFRNWNRFLEKFGSPFLVATMPSSEYSDNAKRTKTLNDLKQMGSSGVAVKSEGSMIEIENAQQGSSQSFAELSAYCDNLFTLAILGQLGTSAVSSGFSNGGAQSAVRTDLLHSDARMIEGCINAQILKPLLAFNGIDPAGWSFVIKTDPAEDDKLTAETWQIVSTLAGKTIDSEQLSERFSVRFGNELPTAGERSELAMSDSTPNDIDMIVTKSIKSAVDDAELWATWSEPVAEMIREAFEGVDLENDADIKARLKTVSDALPDMFEKMDSTRMEEHLQKALLAGKVEGYQMEGAK